mgnify:CR=1 FL=1
MPLVPRRVLDLGEEAAVIETMAWGSNQDCAAARANFDIEIEVGFGHRGGTRRHADCGSGGEGDESRAAHGFAFLRLSGGDACR